MKNNSINTIKTVLIIIVFVVMILYIFVSSAVEGRNYKGKTPDMYGMGSLEYIGEPVMKIFVWQKNERNPDDYPDHTEKYGVNSRLFYDLVPLTMRAGETVSTSQNLYDDDYQNAYTAVTVEYDGPISGQCEIPVPAFLYYTTGKDRIPAKPFNLGGGNTSDFSSTDGTFLMDKIATLFFVGAYHQINNRTREDMEILLKQRVGEHNYDILKHLSIEKLTDVYLEAPQALNGIYRYKFSCQITIHAGHPTKSDVVVASAVLQINQYSVWRWEDDDSLELLRNSEYADQAYSDITVVSYTQSDMFSFE